MKAKNDFFFFSPDLRMAHELKFLTRGWKDRWGENADKLVGRSEKTSYGEGA
jgi:hypothetical protein